MAEKRVFDEETKRMMAGVLPFGSTSTVEIAILEGAKGIPDDICPVFTSKLLNREQRRKSFDYVNRSDSLTGQDLDDATDIARACITGWKNIWDMATGEEIEFVSAGTGAGAKIELWYELPMFVRVTVFNRLCYLSGVRTLAALGLK